MPFEVLAVECDQLAVGQCANARRVRHAVDEPEDSGDVAFVQQLQGDRVTAAGWLDDLEAPTGPRTGCRRWTFFKQRRADFETDAPQTAASTTLRIGGCTER